ncbi:hypothetical protein [Bradyrhizobium sp. AC87j1]|uniref:hypothetical protein n=1 Tax=Bradyrhizobium sp. AC87j1 TaxID=2055894 RepID=UPI0011B02E37|nr:hypothetical protein [Bradyrhizobium sp. AC87j1]
METSSLRSALLGLAVAAGSVAVLAHGLLGLGSKFTGLALVVPLALLVGMAPWREIRPNLCDGLAAALAVCIAVACLLNGYSDLKELVLLVVTLTHYGAGRLAPVRDARRGVLTVGAIVVAVGTLATTVALAEQWSDHHGKPYVFGEFDAAPAQFAMLLGVVVIAAVTSDRLPRMAFAGISMLAVLAAAVFAASMVRFSLLALELAALAGALLCEGAARRRGLVLVALLAVAIGAGATARWSAASVYGRHLLTATGVTTVAPDARMLAPVAVGCPAVDFDNSIAIRKQLLADALRILPEAGPFGIGAGGFAVHSCVPGLGAHNSFVEVAIEFGWLAGLLLIASVSAAWRSVTPLARVLADYRFVACMTLFVVLLSLAHGRISRDFVLLLTLGLAGHLRATRSAVAQTWMLRGLVPWPLRRPVG